jgi:proteasome lid subunit RPN8/RPN11
MYVDLNNPAHPGHSNHLISTRGKRAQRVWHHESPLYESTVEQLLLDWNREVTEQCGFIDSEQELWYVENAHEKPRSNFLMDNAYAEESLNQIYNESRGRTVLGIFHTHPNNVPWPSPRDIVGWPNPRLKWRYFIVTSGEVLEWELTND